MLTTSLHADGYVRKPGQPVPGAIVLLSDGAQNRGILQPAQAAHLAKAAGVRIYPVSLGTPNGTVTFGFGAVHEPDPGAARPGDDERDRADDRRQGLHRPDRLERRPDLPLARLEHRPRRQAGRDHLLVRGRRRRAPARRASATGALLGSRLP